MSTIKVTGLAYVSFQAPDLEAMKAFLTEFGMLTAEQRESALFMKGHGSDPFLHQTVRGEAGFAGLGLKAASVGDLEALAAATGSKVCSVDSPGGGFRVSLVDPDGFRIDVVSGMASLDSSFRVASQEWNIRGRAGRLSKLKRLARGASHVGRLGHCVLTVSDFRRSERWYKSHFGFVTSDEVEAASGRAVGAFLRCDLGESPAEHHSLFLMQSGNAPAFRHAAFEVEDLDDLMLGHDHLARLGHRSSWGVGRHLLGSQVFDYWPDPWGHLVEHYTDSDLLTQADGPNIVPHDQLHEVQWGAGFPGAEFLKKGDGER